MNIKVTPSLINRNRNILGNFKLLNKQTKYRYNKHFKHKLVIMTIIIIAIFIFLIFILMNGMQVQKNSLTQNNSFSFSNLNLESILPPNGKFLLSFLQPRHSGSEGSRRVQNFLISHFQHLLYWHMEKDEFYRRVPGNSNPVQFVNLIFTLGGKDGFPISSPSPSPSLLPPSLNQTGERGKKKIILAAHYDSKFKINGMNDGTFIGATDSAWSCALLVEIATSISKSLNSFGTNSKIKDSDLNFTLQIIFFDGEEAFHEWSESDSLYGSRHFVTHKLQDPSSIQLMVLLDLLGAPNPKLHSMIASTKDQHLLMRNIERRLRESGVISPLLPIMFSSEIHYQANNFHQITIQDDHVPFVEKGVPVLHLIPVPFPSVWHNWRDNVDALDKSTCQALALIIYEFVKEKLLK